jgi:hypothetical protein
MPIVLAPRLSSKGGPARRTHPVVGGYDPVFSLLATLTPEEEWHAAVEQAEADGTFFIAVGHHRAVGTSLDLTRSLEQLCEAERIEKCRNSTVGATPRTSRRRSRVTVIAPPP